MRPIVTDGVAWCVGREPCNKSSAVAEIGDCLATIDMGRKLGTLFGGGRVGPHLTQCPWDEAYLRTKWHLDPYSRLATIDMGQKLGDCAPFRGSWVPI